MSQAAVRVLRRPRRSAFAFFDAHRPSARGKPAWRNPLPQPLPRAGLNAHGPERKLFAIMIGLWIPQVKRPCTILASDPRQQSTADFVSTEQA